MGQIREEFILADEFSATFSRFLQMGQGAADQLTVLDRSNQGFAQSSANAARELDSMRSALAAQQTLHAAQSQRLEAQGARSKSCLRNTGPWPLSGARAPPPR